MEGYSLFDIIGPEMIGPSSSHTAGAAKIGYMSRKIFKQPIKKVIFYLHGSFAETYKGHGTDKALLAGIIGMQPDDERMNKVFKLVESMPLEYAFKTIDLGNRHPNSVLIHLFGDTSEQKIIGSSIGGGKAMIDKIDDVDVSISGRYATLMTVHKDCPGMIARISGKLAKHQINIAYMKLYRENKGDKGILVIEADEAMGIDIYNDLSQMDDIYKVTYFEAF